MKRSVFCLFMMTLLLFGACTKTKEEGEANNDSKSDQAKPDTPKPDPNKPDPSKPENGKSASSDGLATIKALGGYVREFRVNFEGTKVTDVGLEHLQGLTGLKYLNLKGTKVTEAGAEKLRKALPKCTIYIK